ncbi:MULTISPECIES: DUF418 domain-containing protein [Catenuloplanes]|uniref:Membrane protein YeiB n=1 Tax=Catenuloplanes niger TaxID=587534 RepID=A0AAE3ZXL3_9ACTN|nr:DUF418 domain-containing protein [Catenuloplanes niger]MDR7327772.1 putative membrane protein YeiB [Catenuloplanes niger]
MLFLLAGPALGIDSADDLPAVVGVILLQAGWSALWLRHARCGPAEWAWRCLTRWCRRPLRRAPATPVPSRPHAAVDE